MQTAAFRPIRLSPWASPTVVVDLPSPSGVGLIAVTTTYLPRGLRRLEPLDPGERDLRLRVAVRLDLVVAESEVVGDVHDRAGRDRSGDLEVGREAHRAPRVGGRCGRVSTRWQAPSAADRRGARGGTAVEAGRTGRRLLLAAARPGRGGRAAGRSSAARRRPGTGVIADATRRADSKSTSPTSAPSTTLIPTSTTTAPRRSMSPRIRPGWPTATTRISASFTCRARSRVREWQTVTVAFSRTRRNAAGMPTTADRPMTTARLPSISIAGSTQDLDRGVGRRRQEAVVAEPEQAGVQRMDPVDVLGRIDRVDDAPQPDRRRERHLDDDPVHRRVGVQRRGSSRRRSPRTPRRRPRRAGPRSRPSRSSGGSAGGRPSTARRGRR